MSAAPAEGCPSSHRNCLPLSGLSIIDLSTYVAGPSGTMTLAQLGAEVIRVDPPGGATDTRRLPLAPNGTSLYWAGLNKAKLSVEIDTSTAEGRDIVGSLVNATGGILLTNAVGQAWLEYDSLLKYRGDLIEVHIKGRSDGAPAVDYTVNCEIGLPFLTGPINTQRPVNHVLPAWDLLTGLHAAIAILAAERRRCVTGEGQLITLSLADVAVATMGHLGFIADVVVNGSSRSRDGNYVYGTFGCDFGTADAQRVMVVALTARQWHKLVQVTGIAEAIRAFESTLRVDLDAEDTRYRYRAVLEALIQPWFESRAIDEIARTLDEAKVLWGRYRTIAELVNDPNTLLHAGDLMAQTDNPGVGTFPSPRSVLSSSAWGRGVPSPAHLLGQDTEAVLSRVLDMNHTELTSLRDRSIIGDGRGR